MSSLVWQRALWEEGTNVMYEVTVHLYPKELPPQMILEKELYYRSFDCDQRSILESWKENGTFNISSLAREFDITLHFAVQKYVCKLSNYKSLFDNVKSLVTKRNEVAHSPYAFQPLDDNVNEELDDLSNLCINILEDLEDCTGNMLFAKKNQIQRSIQSKKTQNSGNRKDQETTIFPLYKHFLKPEQTPERNPERTPFSRPRAASSQEDESGMSDLGKLALGVGAIGAVGVGIAALIGAFMDDKEKKEKK